MQCGHLFEYDNEKGHFNFPFLERKYKICCYYFFMGKWLSQSLRDDEHNE